MKRFISLCLTGLLIFGLLPVCADAAQTAPNRGYSDVLYANNFSDYPYSSHLGGLICNYPLTQDNLKVWYDANHGFVLKSSMKKASNNDGHYIRVYGGENNSIFVDRKGYQWEITADVMLDVTTRLDVSVWMGAAQTFFVPLRFSEKGAIECGYRNEEGDYQVYMNYSPGVWYRIKLYLDLANNTYSVVVNDRALETDKSYTFPYDFFHAALYLGLNNLTDTITAGDNWLWVDNISVARFDSFGYDYKSDEGYRHMAISDDFETGAFDSRWEIPDSNSVITVDDPDGLRGRVAKLSGTYPRLYSTYRVAGQKQITERYTTEELQRVRIKADLRFDDLKNGSSAAALNLQAYDAYQNKISTLISFNKNNPIYYPFGQTGGLNLTREGNWKSGTWYSVTLYLDMVRGLGTAKVTDGTNEITLLEDFDLTGWQGYSGSQTRIDALRIEAGTSTEGAAYVDNVSYAVMTPGVKVSHVSETGGRVNYTYFSDLFDGEAATLFAAVSNGNKLVSVTAVPLTPQKLTAAEVSDCGAYAAAMTDEVISAHHAVTAGLSYQKQAGETVRFYLWGGSFGCKPLETAVGAVDEPVSAQRFEQVASDWRTRLVGDGSFNSEDEIAVQSVEAINQTAEKAWQKQQQHINDTDILFSSVTSTADMTQQYVYLNQMAKAWGTAGGTLYHNSALLTDITSGLDWLYEHYYGQNEIKGRPWRNPALYNWWDWLVGVPTQLNEILMILGDSLSRSRINRYLSPVEYFMVTEGPKHDAGSRVMNGLASAVLRQDGVALYQFMDDLESVLKITPQTLGVNGLKSDGSYIEHDMYLYNAGYGVSIVAERGMTLYSIFKASGLLPKSLDTDVIELAIHETFEPILYDGCLFSAFSGRRSSSEVDGGERVLAVLLDILDSLDADEREATKELIRRNVSDDTLSSLASHLTVYQATVLSRVLAETAANQAAYERAKVYYAGDAVVKQTPSYAAALSMSSSRRANYESINGMNLDGWYQSDGALYVYSDGAQFDSAWWKGRNPYHMPGVTADTQEREAKSIYYTEAYRSGQDFVGGVELKTYATAAMALEAFHNETDSGRTDQGYGGSQPVHQSTLTAKKSWFFLDDEIICLGADINARDDFEVQTTLENRLIKSDTAISIGGRALPGSSYNGSIYTPGWVHIDGFGAYWIPQAEPLYVKKSQGASTFLELWLSHGVNPTAADYCYGVLPGATAAEAAAYSQSPDVTVLANNSSVQAVCDEAAGLTGLVFWEGAAIGNISSDAAMVVMLEETEGTLRVAVSDPTHKLKTSTLRLDGRYTLRTASDRITAGSGADHIELTINFAESGGKTLTAELGTY